MSKFVIDLEGSEGQKWRESLIIDENGEFESPELSQYGYDKSHCSINGHGARWNFSTVTTSPKDGKIEWHGKVKGDRVEGKAQWTALSGKIVHFKFKGSETHQ